MMMGNITGNVRQLWSVPNLTETVVPAGVGLAAPLYLRDKILAKLPSGFVGRLGRFGTAVGDALIATGIAAGSALLPGRWSRAGLVAASAGAGLALYDATMAAMGKVRMVAPAPVTFSATPASASVAPAAGYR
jgi:hypothetical protein